ncbi:MAG: glycosyltransferase [Opitutales bacterium]
MKAAENNKSVLMISEPGVDGVFRHVEGLIDYLLLNEWQVHFAYSSQRSSERLFSLVRRVSDAGGMTADLKIGNAPEVRDIGAWWTLRRMVKEVSPCVIHGHSSKGGTLARVISNIPVLYTPNAYFGMGFRSGAKAFLFNFVERLLSSRGVNIHVSPEESAFAQTVLKINSERMVEIPNAVDFDAFRPASSDIEKKNLKAEMGIEADAWVLGSIGRISYQKNPELLYRSFEAFSNRRNDAKLCLLHVGGGSREDLDALSAIAERFNKNTIVVRPVYRSDPEVFYKVMDAFCLSSRYEGLPFTALEALASDLPLVLTDGPGLRSFADSKYGFEQIYYAASDNIEMFAEAILTCFNQRERGTNHRSASKDFFSINSVYGRIVDLYTQSKV